ncbi:MAG: LPS export ABC transporter periplasmic protein LptC [Chthoniobacteraceae bacterium]|jgi:hypothetical protein
MKPSGKNHGIYAATLLAISLAISLAGALAWGDSASPAPTTPRFNVPIPVDHDARGVRLPYYDDRGKLQMYFIIDKAYRADDSHLDMKNAYMQTYDDKGTPDASVFMTRSVLDLNTRIVTSDVPVIVRRSDFQITGQKMVFNTQTHKGKMSGHVRMIIYNRQAANKPAASPSPAAGTSPRPKSTP